MWYLSFSYTYKEKERPLNILWILRGLLFIDGRDNAVTLIINAKKVYPIVIEYTYIYYIKKNWFDNPFIKIIFELLHKLKFLIYYLY